MVYRKIADVRSDPEDAVTKVLRRQVREPEVIRTADQAEQFFAVGKAGLPGRRAGAGEVRGHGRAAAADATNRDRCTGRAAGAERDLVCDVIGAFISDQ